MGLPDPDGSPSSPPRAATRAALFSFFSSLADFDFDPASSLVSLPLSALPFGVGLAD